MKVIAMKVIAMKVIALLALVYIVWRAKKLYYHIQEKRQWKE